MNYIEQFMEDNELYIGVCFKIDKLSGEYVFDEDLVLWKKCRQDVSEIASVALVGLLTGRCQPVTKMEQVAKILGVKLDEEFNMNKDGTEIPNGPFKLTKRGLQGKDGVLFPTYFMKLLTGRYKVVPIEQED
ncbi:hypothetical protein CJ260_00535 [Megasphaera sp. ASD88]|uniref:hypothetical protein n=1 Tax=Megasphaera sp. ASD88 TaxID=2027407 RepID=UPI000BABE799|nr:hypothetical protein [Megasphaera sp. ASD88]PAV39958.1 hypothetical protein CJ260_00535 [Megasphaera sp. ASD88]